MAVGNTHPRPREGFGRESATETILSRLSREKGEKCTGVFALESKATVLCRTAMPGSGKPCLKKEQRSDFRSEKLARLSRPATAGLEK